MPFVSRESRIMIPVERTLGILRQIEPLQIVHYITRRAGVAKSCTVSSFITFNPIQAEYFSLKIFFLFFVIALSKDYLGSRNRYISASMHRTGAGWRITSTESSPRGWNPRNTFFPDPIPCVLSNRIAVYTGCNGKFIFTTIESVTVIFFRL